MKRSPQNWWRLHRARRTEAAFLNKFGDLECITEPQGGRIFLTVTRNLNTIETTWRRACIELAKLPELRESALEERLRDQTIRRFAAGLPETIASDSTSFTDHEQTAAKTAEG